MSVDPITERWMQRRNERDGRPTHVKASECETPLDLWELVEFWLDKVEIRDSWFMEAGAALRKLYEAATKGEPVGVDEKIEGLLARRAEDDARRWEAAAIEMERQRNTALGEARVARSELAAGRLAIQEEARRMIDALDEHASRIAANFEIHLPQRGCEHDEW